jgi:CelD/BcsL family acetyltransferase involved in cellulose biosynthesis
MIAECYGFSSFGFALQNDAGDLVAGVPVVEARGVVRGRRWISLPYTDYCPRLGPADPEVQIRFETELDAARRQAGVRSVELRAAPAGSRTLAVPGGFRHTLQLDPDVKATFGSLKPSVRNKVRSAERSGVTVTRGDHEDDLTRTFYALHTATRRRLGVPVQPRRYFSLLWHRLLERELGFLLIARWEGRPVAAAVFLAWNDTVVYKYSASDASALSLRPNNALLWEAISWACDNGYSTFDFGRTEPANPGLREFKRGWGTDEAPLAYAVIGPDRVSASRSERASRFFGPFIRRTPPFVCRGIGRALYRYAA